MMTIAYALYALLAFLLVNAFFISNHYHKVRTEKTNYRVVLVDGKEEAQIKNFLFPLLPIHFGWKDAHLMSYDHTKKDDYTTAKTIEEKIEFTIKYHQKELVKPKIEVVKTFE